MWRGIPLGSCVGKALRHVVCQGAHPLSAMEQRGLIGRARTMEGRVKTMELDYGRSGTPIGKLIYFMLHMMIGYLPDDARDLSIFSP